MTSTGPSSRAPSRNTSGINISSLPKNVQQNQNQNHYETSPLLGTSLGARVPHWGTLAKEMERTAPFTTGESGNGTGTRPDTPRFEGTDDESERDGGMLDEQEQEQIGHRQTQKPVSRKRSLLKKVKQRSKYYVPVMEWLPNYTWSLLPGDIVSGLTVACLIIPQSMSYASGLAHLPPLAGLYSVAFPAVIYALFGTCRQLSVGPEAALSLVLGQVINDAVMGDPHVDIGTEAAKRIGAAISVMMTMQVGMITFFLGICRLGFLDVVLSRALLRGFITAVGIIILIEQLIPMLGLTHLLVSHKWAKTPLMKLIFIFKHISSTNPLTATMSFVSLGCLIAARIAKAHLKGRVGKVIRYIPEILIIVIVSTLLTGLLDLDLKGIDILGTVEGAGIQSPLGNPFKPKVFKHFRETLPTAAVIAVVGYVDSIVAAKENSARFGYAISPNRELVGLGLANFGGSFLTVLGCLPSFGSITRSRLIANVGGRSPMVAIVTATTAVVVALFLLPYLYYLPKAILASIITVVVYSILSEAPHDLLFYWRVKAWTDFLQATMTFLLTIFFNVELGLVASAFFSLILVIQKSTQTRIKIIGRLPGSDEWIPIDETPDGVTMPEEDMAGVLVVRIRENLSFANTGQLKERLRRLELYGASKHHPSDAPHRDHAQIIVFHMNDVEEIDASALQIFLELSSTYAERGVGVYFVHLRSAQRKQFEAVGLTDMLGSSHFQPDLKSAMKTIEGLGYASTFTRYSV